MTSKLDDFLRMAAEIEHLGPPSPREFRIHPLDLEELKGLVPRAYPAHGQADSFLGLRLVVDENAPRMPRVRS